MEDIVRSHTLSPKQVLRVFSATCSAVAHMHSQRPPIIHRDLKVNLMHTCICMFNCHDHSASSATYT